jgi:hypothetical protein
MVFWFIFSPFIPCRSPKTSPAPFISGAGNVSSFASSLVFSFIPID